MKLFLVCATVSNIVIRKFLVRANTNEEAQSKVSKLDRYERSVGEPLIPSAKYTLSSEPVEWGLDVIPLD